MYEPHYEEESGGGGFLIGLLCGTALGAAIGLMFAPKAGSEFRQRLYDSTGDIRRKAYETYDQASEQVNNVVTKGRQAVERGRKHSTARGSRRRPGNRRQRQHHRFRQPESPGRFRLQHRHAHRPAASRSCVTQDQGRGQREHMPLLLSALDRPLSPFPSHSSCQPCTA